jgi:hypothetical protein
MAINREGYSSLIESIQEATSMAPSSKGGVSRVRGGRAASTSTTQNKGVQWGDQSIGGAMNATELAQWLASQQGGGKPSPNTLTTDASGVASGAAARNAASVASKSTGGAKKSSSAPAQRSAATSGGWGGSGVFGAKNAEDLARILNQMQNDGPSVSAGGKSKMTSRKSVLARTSGGSTTSSKPSAKKPTVSVADVQEALEILEAWSNGPYGAKDGSDLARILNNMQNNTPTVSDASKMSKGSRKNPLARTSGTSSTGSSTSTKGPAATTASSVVSEDWDILDEILEEGIELYGEDGLAEILADFAETGEISDELALLLSDE